MKLSGKGLEPLAGCLNGLCEGGLTGLMVAKEFVWRRIAPLQDHRHRMWAFTGDGDQMMLHPSGLTVPTVDEAIKTLFTEVGVPDLAYAVLPLYRLKTRDDILAAMPRFDWWGLRPEGQEGEHENPLLLVLGSGPKEEAEESEDTGVGEAESSRTCRHLFIQAISSDDEDAAEDFIVAPSRFASVGVEEENDEARDEPHVAEGSLAEAAAGGVGSSGPSAASPPPPSRRRHPPRERRPSLRRRPLGAKLARWWLCHQRCPA
jgi:hypothetical protein